jgi:hypothetical protein
MTPNREKLLGKIKALLSKTAAAGATKAEEMASAVRIRLWKRRKLGRHRHHIESQKLEAAYASVDAPRRPRAPSDLETSGRSELAATLGRCAGGSFVSTKSSDMSYRAETRTFDRLHCICGRMIKPHDLEAHDGGVSLVCPSCHEDLLQIKFDRGRRR